MGDDGLGLIEVLVALTIFLISFLPLVMFLPTGWKIVVNSEDQRFATALAYSTLQNDQLSPFPGTFPDTTWYVGTDPQTWTGVSGTPPAGAPNTTVPGVSTTHATQGGVTFQIYTAGGWCVANNAGFGIGPVAPSTPASYHVVVMVGWGPGISMSSRHVNVVIDSTELSSVSGAPASATTVNSCPLGLA